MLRDSTLMSHADYSFDGRGVPVPDRDVVEVKVVAAR